MRETARDSLQLTLLPLLFGIEEMASLARNQQV